MSPVRVGFATGAAPGIAKVESTTGELSVTFPTGPTVNLAVAKVPAAALLAGTNVTIVTTAGRAKISAAGGGGGTPVIKSAFAPPTFISSFPEQNAEGEILSLALTGGSWLAWAQVGYEVSQGGGSNTLIVGICGGASAFATAHAVGAAYTYPYGVQGTITIPPVVYSHTTSSHIYLMMTSNEAATTDCYVIGRLGYTPSHYRGPCTYLFAQKL
ncbi:MAG: hypothetical protein M0010_15350 [Actinomycetota bacterium]|jgi:hypothetical protein|nr:hypothetical protein [Actinomycetota bacterium]